MKIKNFLILLLILPGLQQVFGQQTATKWDHWNNLVGNWEGEGNGQPGKGLASFSIQPDLNQHILLRKGHTEFPAANGQAAISHDDLMVIYPDYTGLVSKAIYFDNEGHTINYTIAYIDNSIVFTSETIPNMPGFRLSYELLDKETVNIKFAMSSPQKPDEYKTYVEGISKKVK